MVVRTHRQLSPGVIAHSMSADERHPGCESQIVEHWRKTGLTGVEGANRGRAEWLGTAWAERLADKDKVSVQQLGCTPWSRRATPLPDGAAWLWPGQIRAALSHPQTPMNPACRVPK